MALQDVIRQRRKHLGLTQEQLADALCVSVAAVSKWETGQTCPDTAILIPLARRLNIDMNTLFSYHAEMPSDQVREICQEIADLAKVPGISSAFHRAEQVLSDFPHDERLLHTLTVELDSLLKLHGNQDGESACFNEFREIILERYCRLSESNDTLIRNSAQYMLTNSYIDSGAYDSAQQIMDQMFDMNDLHATMADKTMLQIKLFCSRGEYEEAATLIQRSLLFALNRVQVLLNMLVQAELSCDSTAHAIAIADVSEKIAHLCEQNGAQYCGSRLLISQKLQDAEMGLRAIEAFFDAIQHPTPCSDTLLFSKIQTQRSILYDGHMISAVLRQLEQDPSLAFLRNTDAYRTLRERWSAYFEDAQTPDAK